MNSSRKGFTLAEVLITLGIIGVVAAMTMPTLIGKYTEHVTINKFKKFYSTISQVLYQASFDNDYTMPPELYGTSEGAELSYNYFKPYLKIGKDCGFEEGCFPNVEYKRFNGITTINFITHSIKRYMVRLADGSAVAFIASSDNVVYYDVNGIAPPNQFGKDIFQISIYKNKISLYNQGMTECYTNGFTCSDWLIKYGNLEYWHCDDLEYGGKTSCK